MWRKATAKSRPTKSPTRKPPPKHQHPFDRLPNEIIFIILSLVPEYDLYAIVQPSPHLGKFISPLFNQRGSKNLQAELLLWSAYYGVYDVMKEVLDTGFNPNITAYEIPQDDSKFKGQPPWINTIGSKGTKLGVQTSPLSLCIIHKHYAMTNLLFSHSAGLNVGPSGANSALRPLLADDQLKHLQEQDMTSGGGGYSIDRFSPENIFKTILVDYDNVCIVRLICHSFVYKPPSRQTMELLRKAKFPPHRGDCAPGDTMLHCAVKLRLTWLVELLLLRDGEHDVNSWPATGISYLHLACKQGSREIARVLIDAGADINKICSTDYDRGETPLHFAVIGCDENLIEMLIAAGADCNAETSLGETPLYMALYTEKYSLAKKLLPHTSNLNFYAQVTIKQRPGRAYYQEGRHSLLHEACRAPYSYLLEQLLERMDLDEKRELMAAGGIGGSLLAQTVAGRRSEHVSTLLKHGANASAKDEDGNTMLYKTCNSRGLEIAEMLLEAGADVNEPTTHDNNTVYPLHQAMVSVCPELVMMLLERGAYIHARNSPQDETPLHVAAMKSGSEFIVQALLDRGANLTALDYRKYTPLHSLAKTWYLHMEVPYEQIEVARILLQADPSVIEWVNIEGNTALDMIKVSYKKLNTNERSMVPEITAAGWNALLDDTEQKARLRTRY